MRNDEESNKKAMRESILNFLNQSNDYVSGQHISRELKISRAAVGKHVQMLRRQGFQIDALPRVGYKLVASADKIYATQVQAHLTTLLFGRKIVTNESVPSTMDMAFSLALQGASEGTVVCAETQTQGRGRQGRPWHSPQTKGLYVSFILNPTLSIGQLGPLTLMAAVAIIKAVERVCDLHCDIKWPNDILYNGKKLAGILTEMRGSIDLPQTVIIGIGLNVNATAQELIPGATSLKMATKKNVNRNLLLAEICNVFEDDYAKAMQDQFAQVLLTYRQRCVTLHSKVKIRQGQKDIEGEAVDVTSQGALMIKGADGSKTPVFSGEIVSV